MKIILIDRRLDASRSIALGRWSLAVLSLCCLGLPLGMVAVGYYIGKVTEVPEALAPLKDEVAAHNQALADLRAEAERRLQALSMSVGEMEARLLRLDAMGQRLTDLAGLDDGEFDFSRSPALGGPLTQQGVELTALNQPLGSNESARLTPSTLASEMGDLEARIADREQQLDMLQALLSNRQLQNDVFLSGPSRRAGCHRPTASARTPSPDSRCGTRVSTLPASSAPMWSPLPVAW